MVGGRVIFRDGKLQCENEDDIKAEINEIWPDYRRSCDLGNQQNQELVRIYKAVCERAANTDVDFSRWLDLR
jgi:hypothetical protein